MRQPTLRKGLHPSLALRCLIILALVLILAFLWLPFASRRMMVRAYNAPRRTDGGTTPRLSNGGTPRTASLHAPDASPLPASDSPVSALAEDCTVWQYLTRVAHAHYSGDPPGYSNYVDIDGDTLVVGANTYDVGTESAAGAVYVFYRNEGGTDNWGLVKRVVADDANNSDYFGHSVAVDGDTLVVGAIWDDEPMLAQGTAYVFYRNHGGADNWGQVAQITPSDAAASDEFGYSVAIDGDIMVVGARWAGAGGKAYVFYRNQGGADSWGAVTKLSRSDAAAADDQYGISVAIDGSIAAVGSYKDDDNGWNSGAAYLFYRNQGGADNWGQFKKLTPSPAASEDYFGRAVAIDGNTVVVGAEGYDTLSSVFAGSAYVFYRNQGGADNWGQVAQLTASDGADFDYFGHAADINGDCIIIGAYRHDKNPGGDDRSGAGYLFQRDQGGADSWGEVQKLFHSSISNYDYLGAAAAIDGDTVALDAPGKNRTYIYEKTVLPDLQITKVAAPTEIDPGGEITFTIAYTNNAGLATGVQITDIIPSEVTVSSISHSGATITDTSTTPAYVWDVDNLAQGDGGDIIIKGTVNAVCQSSPSSFSNTAEISSSEQECDSSDNQGTITVNVRASNPSIQTLQIDQPDPCADTINYTASIADPEGVDTLIWRLVFSDGGAVSASGSTVSGSYPLQDPAYCGNVQATLTVTDEQGCTDTMSSNTVDVNQPPSVSGVAISQPDPCADSIDYTATISDCDDVSTVSWQLAFSDGGSVTGSGDAVSGAYSLQDPAYCGDIQATLTITDDQSCTDTMSSNTVDVNQPPTISSLTISQPNPCVDEIDGDAYFRDCDGGDFTVQLTFSDGASFNASVVAGTSDVHVIISYSLQDPAYCGNIQATLTVTDEHSCSDTLSSNTVDINQPPQIDSLTIDRPDPSSDVVNYAASVADCDGDDLTWDLAFFDGGLILGSGTSIAGIYHLQDPSYSGDITGTLTISDTSQCTDTMTTVFHPGYLQVTKTDLQDPVPATWYIRYTIVVTNTAGVAAGTIWLTDTLPAGTYLASVPANDGWAHEGAVVTRTVSSLAPGSSVSFSLHLGTHSTTRGPVNNTVEARWGTFAISDTETTTVIEPPGPATKTPTPTPTNTPTPTPTSTRTPTPTPTGTLEPQVTGCIAAYAWNDLNGNGVPDPGEPPLPGAFVEIFPAQPSTGAAAQLLDTPIASCAPQMTLASVCAAGSRRATIRLRSPARMDTCRRQAPAMRSRWLGVRRAQSTLALRRSTESSCRTCTIGRHFGSKAGSVVD